MSGLSCEFKYPRSLWMMLLLHAVHISYWVPANITDVFAAQGSATSSGKFVFVFCNGNFPNTYTWLAVVVVAKGFCIDFLARLGFSIFFCDERKIPADVLLNLSDQINEWV